LINFRGIKGKKMNEEFNIEYTAPVVDEYQKVINLLNSNKEKNYKKVYNDLTKMLEESYFVGATKFGNNFIA